MKYLLIIKLLISLFVPCLLRAQNTISLSGPACALSGQAYQYNIVGPVASGAQLCVSGGTIVGGTSNCLSDLSPGYVKITWSATGGSLSFTSSKGDASLSVSVTAPLQSGTISQGTKTQYIDYNKVAQTILCAPASGGSCAAQYQYQWQFSIDKLSWQDINGANAQNLSFSNELSKPLFFRRKTTEVTTQTIVYSDEAVVYVNPDMTGH